MSTLGFEVHVDKENATYIPSINKGGPIRTFGLKEAKGKVQATPRKALIDVKQVNVSASRNLDRNKSDSCSTNLKDGCFSTAKPSVISNGAENKPHGLNIKQDLGKPASVQKKGLKILKNTEPQTQKVKPTTKSKKPKSVLKSEPDVADDEYDSDSVFPGSERLSNYVDKLISWRFPCLFGSVTESDSESSDFEELLNEEMVLDIPNLVPEVPEFSDADLDTLMDGLPPPEPDFEDN